MNGSLQQRDDGARSSLGVQYVEMVATVQQVKGRLARRIARNGRHWLRLVLRFGVHDDDVDLEEVGQHRGVEVVAVMAAVVHVGGVVHIVGMVHESDDGVDVGQRVGFQVGLIKQLALVLLETLVESVDHATQPYMHRFGGAARVQAIELHPPRHRMEETVTVAGTV